MNLFNPKTGRNGLMKPIESSNGNRYLYCKSVSGLDGDTPSMILPYDDGSYQGLFATAIADSVAGSITSFAAYVGVPSEGSIAAGGFGLVQIEGPRENVQCGAALVSGSIGHAMIWSITAVGCAGSAYVGAQNQWGILSEEVTASTTANVFLTGKMCAGAS